SFGGCDAEQQCGPHHEQPDAQIACEQGNEEPVAEIGQQLALAPPRTPWIAASPKREDGECSPKCDRHRHDLDERDANTVDDRNQLIEHDAPVCLPASRRRCTPRHCARPVRKALAARRARAPWTARANDPLRRYRARRLRCGERRRSGGLWTRCPRLTRELIASDTGDGRAAAESI